MRLLTVTLMLAGGALVTPAAAASGSGKSGTTYRDVVLADSPMMYWRLGESSGTTAFDETANHRDATYYGAPTLGQPGAIVGATNTSVGFDGTDDQALWTPTSSYSGDYTVEAWVKMANPTAPSTFFGTRGPGEYSFDFKVQSGNFLHLDVGTGARWLTTGGVTYPYATGVWYYFAAAITPSGATLYADGVKVATIAYAGKPLLFDPNHLVTIGNYRLGGSEWFDGNIDEVAVYGRALPADRIAAHYLTGVHEGLVQGNVSDLNDALPVAGAKVRALHDGQQVAAVTTDATGAYSFALARGTYSVAAGAPNYGTRSAKVDVSTVGQVIQQAFSLPTARAAVDPTSLAFKAGTGQTESATLTLSNTGTRKLTWQTQESLGAASKPLAARRARSSGFDPNAPTTEGLYARTARVVAPAAPGDIIRSWSSSSIPLAWGVGYTGKVWLSDADDGSCGASCTNTEFDPFGNPTGRQWATPWAGAWPADMAYDRTRGVICQVNVGGNNGIYCWDPSTGAVTGSISGSFPWTQISQRGLAYVASDDTFYVGGWNQGVIYHIHGLSYSDPGAVIGQCNPPDSSISGLAFNADAGVLWEATNSATDTIYELNPSTCAEIASLAFPTPGYNGAGLEMDATGNLWATSQGAHEVYLIDSGVTAFSDVPWLSESKTSGSLGAGRSTRIMITADATGLQPGIYAATLYIQSNSGRDPLIAVAINLTVSFVQGLSGIVPVGPTIPTNGDLNPYGVAVVPASVGNLVAGDVLVSNFNDAANLQGTGRTIVQVSPDGSVSTFATIDPHDIPGPCPGGVGLTTALAILPGGWVVVGSLPTTDGTANTAKPGCLIVVNSDGAAVETIAGGAINGPWDMTAVQLGTHREDLFVTNVLNGTVAGGGNVVKKGSVVRLSLYLGSRPPTLTGEEVIGSRFGERTDPAALVVGPTGLGLGVDGTLYVADTLGNRIAAIPQAITRKSTAFTGTTVTTGGALNGPLGLAIAPNGDVLTVNGGDGNIVEVTPSGFQVATATLDATGAGTLFGLAVTPGENGIYFVDDGTNTLNLFH